MLIRSVPHSHVGSSNIEILRGRQEYSCYLTSDLFTDYHSSWETQNSTFATTPPVVTLLTSKITSRLYNFSIIKIGRQSTQKPNLYTASLQKELFD